MSPASSDWGVPDWQRPQDYPNFPGPFAMRKWAWQFLRRNPEFREFWLTKVEPFTTWRSLPHYPELRRFGIIDLRSPREADGFPAFSDCVIEYYPASTLLREAAQPPLVPFSEHDIAVSINLSRPIDDQIAEIRRLVVALGKPGRAAKTSSAYPTYLRILDAEDAEVRPAAIAEALFPGVDNVYPGRRRAKVFGNARTEARRLRDSGYRALALRALK
jgi:hypothetical protein